MGVITEADPPIVPVVTEADPHLAKTGHVLDNDAPFDWFIFDFYVFDTGLTKDGEFFERFDPEITPIVPEPDPPRLLSV